MIQVERAQEKMVFLGYGLAPFLARLPVFGRMEAFAKSKIRAPAIKEERTNANQVHVALSCLLRIKMRWS